jgi:hypothetical protein
MYSQLEDGLALIAKHINQPEFTAESFEAAKEDVKVGEFFL